MSDWTLNKHGIKEGDTVIVDVGCANGGYEAKVIGIARVYAHIQVEDSEWCIVISRLTPKIQ